LDFFNLKIKKTYKTTNEFEKTRHDIYIFVGRFPTFNEGWTLKKNPPETEE
jgi:hypothetical protein